MVNILIKIIKENTNSATFSPKIKSNLHYWHYVITDPLSSAKSLNSRVRKVCFSTHEYNYKNFAKIHI